MAIDPICGMNVKEDDRAIVLKDNGSVHYFCSEHCKKQFFQQKPQKEPPVKTKTDEKTIYTCPMHPEIRQDHPGDCPKCGMHLESLHPVGEENLEQKGIDSLSKKFWIGLVFTIPLVLLVLGEMIPAINVQSFIPHRLIPFIQFILATPIVLWTGGMFFVKGWQSLVNRSLNMFTLIALGVGAAYGYSTVATFFPQIFPESLKKMGKIDLYFEAAAVITVLIILGQLLEAKARSQTGQPVCTILHFRKENVGFFVCGR